MLIVELVAFVSARRLLQAGDHKRRWRAGDICGR
jgi:hypothetical protein